MDGWMDYLRLRRINISHSELCKLKCHQLIVFRSLPSNLKNHIEVSPKFNTKVCQCYFSQMLLYDFNSLLPATPGRVLVLANNTFTRCAMAGYRTRHGMACWHAKAVNQRCELICWTLCVILPQWRSHTPTAKFGCPHIFQLCLVMTCHWSLTVCTITIRYYW